MNASKPLMDFRRRAPFLPVLAATALFLAGCPSFWQDLMPPTAAFRAEAAGGLDVQFTDESVPGMANITTWEWVFGDGESSPDPDPSHSFAEAGSYAVQLTVTTPLGSDTTTTMVLVLDPAVAPQFTSADAGIFRGGVFFDLEGGEGEGEAPTVGDDGSVPRDVIEPDVIRRDGDILYILNQYRGLTVVDLDGREILAQVPTQGFPRDLYIRDGRAYVLVSNARDYAAEGDAVIFSVKARLHVIDIADPANPEILSSFDLEGDLVDSRLVGDVLYAICAEYSWYWIEGGVAFKDQTSSSWVTSVNVADPENPFEADQVSFEGMGSVIHATNFAIFVANATWGDSGTSIRYIDISDPAGDIEVAGEVRVRGYVADKFKMDAWNGVLRVVSNAWFDTRRVYVTTVDLADPDNLAELAEIEIDRATGETLFATRFDGDIAYLVTFLRVDPLFVIDLSDPANPVVAGELEVPGWSLHIEARGDRLIALGVDDTEGQRASVSLYDVADPSAPTLVDRVTFGQDWSWSSAFSDYKAFTVLDDVLIVPVSGWDDLRGSYDRLQFISWDPGGLETRGYVDLAGGIQRSFEYSDLYYAVTTEQLAIVDGTDLDAPELVDTLTLAEYVADFLELSPTLSAEIVSRLETGEITVRTVDDTGTALGEVTVTLQNLIDAYAYGSSVVLVGSDYSGAARYGVAVVDVSDPAAPELKTEIDVDVTPYSGYWWYDYAYLEGDGFGIPRDVLAGQARKSVVGPYWPCCYDNSAQSTFLLGGTLALRGYSDSADIVALGDGTPNQVIALVDLDAEEWTGTLGLGFDYIVSLDAQGEHLYLGTQDYVEPFSSQLLVAYYLHRIELDPPSVGPRANVPGVFVQYAPDTEVLTLHDFQWTGDWKLEASLRTVLWDGSDAVEPVDRWDLPAGAGTVLGRGQGVYYGSYGDDYSVTHVAVSAAGEFGAGNVVSVSADWARLFDAHGGNAYVVVGDSAIARYDFTGDGQLATVTPFMGYPLKMRFGTGTAHAILGYSGLIAIP